MKYQTMFARVSIILLAAASQMLVAAELPARIHYSVRDYGATGDGKTLDSPAINKTIEAAAAAGGGTVLVPAGTYLSGSIRMKSNIHLKIDVGATILGAPQSMNAYDETEEFPGIAYQDGGHTYFRNSLIWGENLTNVFITGLGTIHGGGLTKDSGILDEMCGYDDFLKPRTKTYPPVRLGNKAIALKLCRNVLIRDVTLVHGGHFAILATGCDNMTLDNLTIDTNRDGIDIDCCRNTTVSNCRINAPGDDGLCIKSTCALGRPVITENLTITNCQVTGFKEGTLLDGTLQPDRWGQGRLKFGTEASGGFRNCTISNCTFRNCWGLALEEVDGGIMENITINNLTMMDIARYPIYITTGKRNRTPDRESVSRMRNILISDVIITGASRTSGIHIAGLEEQPLEGLRLQNIRIVYEGGGTKEQANLIPKELGRGYPEPTEVMPAYGLFARHVKGLELANITFSSLKDDFRPAIQCVNVKGLEIDNLKAQLADGVAASKFENVPDPVIRNSPILQR
ncbi:MAG: glycoside hydrolase family 28 protein [Verrucomicrobiota bacterium]